MKLIGILLTCLMALNAWSQGVTIDTTSYLMAGNLDNYAAWSFSKQSGTLGTVSNYNGLNSNGLRVSYTFPSSGGWVNLEIPIGSAFTRSTPMVFHIYSAHATDYLEIKFIDQDGSVFDLRPSLDKYVGSWHHITAYLSNTSHAWGGNASFDTPVKFSLAISGTGASSGSVYFDEIGIGKAGLPSSFQPTIDPNSEMPGTGFAQRRAEAMTAEDLLVLEYLKQMQDKGSPSAQLLPTYYTGLQAQTFNNCLATLAFLAKDEKERAERILDFYLHATDSNNTELLRQNFFYNRQARGFFQECDIQSLKAMGAKNRWIGDMAWLLMTCQNYQKKYNSSRYEYLISIIKDLFLSFYTEAGTGGYIRHGWENGDANLHESSGHHEGNIDCYVALKLCGEDAVAHQIKLWLDEQLNGKTNLPLDLYTWRTLAFGAMGESYTSLLNIPEYDFRYRKIIPVSDRKVMGLYSHPDLTIQNFWNDGTGYIACAFQAFGDRQRGIFYANQLDPLMVTQAIGSQITHGLPYTLNRQGYEGVDPAVPVISSSAWYILAKNAVNPFLSNGFKDDLTHVLRSSGSSSIINAFPNPFTQAVTIKYSHADASSAFLYIYSIMGQKVKTIELKTPSPGDQTFIWDGTADNNKKIRPGVYLLELVTGKNVENVTVIFLGR